jgi:hypothetical protein
MPRISSLNLPFSFSAPVASVRSIGADLRASGISMISRTSSTAFVALKSAVSRSSRRVAFSLTSRSL